MAVSTFPVHLKGVLCRPNLERILNCILDLGFPIYIAEHDCCNAQALWATISTEGIEHKGGMLYLVVPGTIGRGTFLDSISDIDAEMLIIVILGLRGVFRSQAFTVDE